MSQDTTPQPHSPLPVVQDERQAYRIKPLVWHKRNDVEVVSYSLIGRYAIDILKDRCVWFRWKIGFEVSEDGRKAATLDAAKAAAEKHYVSRLLSALEPVSKP